MTRSAIVVGAGIGGLATAASLLQHGWKVTVVEEHDPPREVGAGIVISFNGMRALDALGVAEPLRTLAPGAHPIGSFTAQGSVLQRQGTEEWSIVHGVHRATLHAALFEAAGDATFVTGAPVVRVVDRADGGPSVTIRRDGAEGSDSDDADENLSADVVIGADGIRSVVRGSMWPKARTDYSGASCWRGVTDTFEGAPSGFQQLNGRQGEFGIVPIDGGRLYWYGSFRSRMGVTATDEKAAALEQFGGYADPVRRVIESTDASAILRNDLHSLVTPLRSFAANGVALVGDAAHAMLPTLGQGANSTLEDAVTIGILLGGASTDAAVDAALAEYDELRRRRTQRLQRLSQELFTWSSNVRNPLLAAVRNGAANLAPTFAAELAASVLLEWTPPAER